VHVVVASDAIFDLLTVCTTESSPPILREYENCDGTKTCPVSTTRPAENVPRPSGRTTDVPSRQV